jgi:hypothetical protein
VKIIKDPWMVTNGQPADPSGGLHVEEVFGICTVCIVLLLREGACAYDLLLKGKDGRLGLVLEMICLRLHIPFSTGVSS